MKKFIFVGMNSSKHFFILSIASLFFACCKQPENKNALHEVAQMPKILKENSGIILDDATHFWAINDSGNRNEVYQLSIDGKITKTIEITNLQNTDWEDITNDTEGSLYIGDFGNNDNARTDLGIYKIATTYLNKTAVTSVQKTTFNYPEQTSFPPKKNNLLYDCEAFFELEGYFYLFTKNRSKHFDGTTLLYKIPNKEGHFKAELLGSYITCDNYAACAITSAAISPDKKTIVLLSHSKIWVIENFKKDDFLNGTITALELNHTSQKEGVCFKNNDILLVTDEGIKKEGGNLYEVSIQQLKAKP